MSHSKVAAAWLSARKTGGLLQRKCACGQHTPGGGECEECRKKRQGTLQRSAPGQPVAPLAGEVLEPRFGRDFSQVRAHSAAPVLQRQPAPGASGQKAGAPAPVDLNPPPKLVMGENFQEFEAVLDRKNCLLTIRKKILFDLPDAPPGSGPMSLYQDWGEGERERFQETFIKNVTERWSFKYLLEPAAPCPGEPCKTMTAAVQVVPAPQGQEHIKLTVHKLAPDWPAPKAGVLGREAHMVDKDVKPRKNEGGLTSVPAEHEFGHMLGLEHVNCRGMGFEPGANRIKCYGETAEQKEDIMGWGSKVSEEDYKPFTHAMGLFNSCTWRTREPGGSERSILERLGRGLLGLFLGGVGGAAVGGGIGTLAGLLAGGAAAGIAASWPGALIGGAILGVAGLIAGLAS